MNPGLLGVLNEPGLAPQLKILALMTILSLLPAIVLTMTSFTRAVVVLGFVRQGIGTQQTPPTQVLVGLALFLTMFTMAPTANAILHDAYEPYAAAKITEEQAFERASGERAISPSSTKRPTCRSRRPRRRFPSGSARPRSS
jgi:flagellar biosynthetic protein FliP